MTIKCINAITTSYGYLKFYTNTLHDFKTSLYTIFFVLFPARLMFMFLFARTHVLSRDTPLDRATYNCPCEKTCSGR